MNNNIKAIRKEQGLSVTELAIKLNMSQGNLSKIENNQIELKRDLAAKIAETLHVSQEAIWQSAPTSTMLNDLPLINPEAVNLAQLSRISLPVAFLKNKANMLFVQTEDTMAPSIPAGALICIDKSNKQLANGIFLVKINNTLQLRRLQTTFTQGVYLLCDNASYQPMQIEKTEIEIIGKAISYIVHHFL